MRPVNEITAEQENFRLEVINGFNHIRKDFVKPEPEGSIVLMAFRITGYNQDCDGSALSTLEHINNQLQTTGWAENCVGLDPESALVVPEEELKRMFQTKT